LGRLPERTDETQLYDRASFIAADTEDELDMLTERNPQVGKAVVKLRELSADEKARELYERREKKRMGVFPFFFNGNGTDAPKSIGIGQTANMLSMPKNKSVDIQRQSCYYEGTHTVFMYKRRKL